jgi:rhodanese-related sulfurtransferase
MILSYSSKNGFNNILNFFYSKINNDNFPIIKSIKNYINDKSTYMLDIRGEKEIKKGFIQNSIISPLSFSFPIISQILNKNKKIILISDKNEKEKNSEAIKTLNYLGHKNILGLHSFNNNEDKLLLNKINYFPLLDNKALMNIIKDNEVIIDIREPNEYKETGIIKSSYLFPVSLLKYNFKLIPKNKKIYILCLSGRRALIIYSYLLRKGFPKKDLYVIKGGISNLIKLNFPLIKF